jgi:hypothetical protein
VVIISNLIVTAIYFWFVETAQAGLALTILLLGLQACTHHHTQFFFGGVK